LVATTTTSATGIYNFADIATGEYSLEFAAPNGYQFSAADRGTDDAIDSDANPTTGRTGIFTVNAGENLSWDAGLYQLASVSGTNWQDTNGNGAKDTNETIGLADWTVYLDTNENGTLDTGESSTTTDINGSYSFLNLRPGNYTVAQITKPAWLQTYPRIQVTTTASDIELFTPEIALEVSTASSTPTKPITSLVDLNGLWQTPRFTNIKGQGLSTVIIDTGIDLDHPIFGADADGNGVADRIVYQYDFADNDTDASDHTGHGSHVASIAAQIAPDANLIVLKVFKDNQTGSFTYLEKALQWVNQNVTTYNIASVNLSLGDSRNWNTTNPRYGIGDEIAAISSQNVIIAAAAGNNFYQFNSAAGVSYPAADPNTIAVGAVWSEDFGGPQKFGNGATDYSTGADRIASFSQRDINLLDVFAPGVFVNGANATGGTQSLGGTSQATPFVSGIAVLAQQIALEKLGRKLTVAEFRQLLDDTSTIIQDGDDENDNVANTNLKYPRINLLNLAQGVANFSGSSTNTGVVTPPIIGGSTPSPNVVGTTQILTHSVTLTSGQVLTDKDFGNQPIKSVINGTDQPDYLNGTAGNDTINGLGGNDYLKGGTGNDYLDGGIGNDVLEGSDDSNGLDTFAGGADDDVYGIYNSATVIVENADGGTDTVWTAVNYALTNNIENMYLVGDIAGTGNDDNNLIIGYGVGNNTIYGLGGNDAIYGGEGNDYLNGGTGNDYLDGGIGNDVLAGSGDSNGLDIFAGGAGDDVYGIYNSATIIVENADGGTDTVWTAVDYALTNNIENMYLVGDIAGTGNDNNNLIIGYGVGNNTIYGLGGNDAIYGGEGNDYLNGGTGNDYLDGGIGNDVLAGSGDSNGLDIFAGGAGDDVYGIYNSATIIVEDADGGTDTVWTAVDYALTNNIENMYLVGDIAGTGNDNNNLIIGYGVGNNIIYGLSGNDTISGGLGADTLFGGAGNDTFILSTMSTDTIGDFSIDSDLLRISASNFGGGLTANVALLTTQLLVGSDTITANSTTQRFIFNTTNGDLFFDADGSSSNFTATRIANLSNISSLRAESFLLG
jgi:Ca2+-binding RTX toxin-like protein